MIFASGSCRALDAQALLSDEILHEIPNGMYTDGYKGLSYFHNVKQHIQFVKFLQRRMELPLEIQKGFFTKIYSYIDLNYLEHLRSGVLNECKIFLFEICSLKLYETDYNGSRYQLSELGAEREFSEHKIEPTLQTEKDLYNDLLYLISLLPYDSKIYLQGHFIFPGVHIENRSIINRVLNRVGQEFDHVTIIDPCGEILKHFTRDGIYYTEEGKDLSRHILSSILKK